MPVTPTRTHSGNSGKLGPRQGRCGHSETQYPRPAPETFSEGSSGCTERRHTLTPSEGGLTRRHTNGPSSLAGLGPLPLRPIRLLCARLLPAPPPPWPRLRGLPPSDLTVWPLLPSEASRVHTPGTGRATGLVSLSGRSYTSGRGVPWYALWPLAVKGLVPSASGHLH